MTRIVLLLPVFALIAGCFQIDSKVTNAFEWDTSGNFKIQCERKSPKAGVIVADDIQSKMKTAAVDLCGADYELVDYKLTTRTKTGKRVEQSSSIAFACEPTRDVMADAESFNVNSFCADVFVGGAN